MARTLQAPVTVAFDYTRSTGPVLGTFFTGLRERRLVGARLSDGRVACPPPEYDPHTHQASTEYVDLPDTGTVESWSWVPHPVAGQPLPTPFAWALIRLDGADTPLLHAVDVASPEEIHTGDRVQVRWADEPQGAITDIACFAPIGTTIHPTPLATAEHPEPVTGIITPVSLDYTYAASPEESAFFRGLAQGRLLGQRCPVCHKVYVPPRGACPVDGVPTDEEVPLAGTGTVTTFCIVNVPFLGQRISPPYVSAYVLLDGADIAFLHLIQEVPAAEVRMGMRVAAVWRPREEWTTSVENIAYFRPTGEPDADYASYAGHL